MLYSRPIVFNHSRRILLLATLVFAFSLRLPDHDAFPPGLYHDEAYYGLDAAHVLQGDLHVYFPANNGREPLFIYLASIFVAILGRTPEAVRLAAGFVGTATVAAVYALGTALFHRRVGLIAAFLTAVTPWPVILSRTGFRAGTLPLVLALALAATMQAYRLRGDAGALRRWSALGGALMALTLYTYAAGRLVPVLCVVLGLWVWINWRGRIGSASDGGGIGGESEVWRSGLRVWLLAFCLVSVPMALHFALAPEDIAGRAGQVSVFDEGINQGNLAETLLHNASGTAGMFLVRGDFIPRHNIPLRPVFGKVAGSFWLLGLLCVLVGALRRRLSETVMSVWLIVMALPTLLAENAPHFLRAVGLLPVGMVMVGMGADWLIRRLPKWVFAIEMLIIVAYVHEHQAARLYELGGADWQEDKIARAYAFERGATDLATAVNATIGTGWRGGWSTAEVKSQVLGGPADAAEAPLPVWLDRRLRDGWSSIPYLVPSADSATHADPQTAPVRLVDPYDPILTTGPGVAFMQPEALEWEHIWSDLAPNLRISFTQGALERGDLEDLAKPLFLRIDGRLRLADELGAVRFANSLQLSPIRGSKRSRADQLIVTTAWETTRPITQDVTAFFQVLDREGHVVAASDAPLGSGYFGTSLWRPGDQVVEERTVRLPFGFAWQDHRLIVGLYTLPSAARIPLEPPESVLGRPPADYVVLPPPVWAGGS